MSFLTFWWCFFFQAEDGIRDLVRSRGLGDVYKRQAIYDIPVGEVWPLDKIMELKASVEKHGLELSVIELSLIHI